MSKKDNKPGLIGKAAPIIRDGQLIGITINEVTPYGKKMLDQLGKNPQLMESLGLTVKIKPATGDEPAGYFLPLFYGNKL